MSNAIRHVPGGGAVSLRVEGDGKEVRFTVTDSGPGFAPDQLAHLFERFSRSADSRGSGLGLSIAHDLVLAHGGTIRAFNGPTGGATVSFTLPTAASSHPKPARP